MAKWIIVGGGIIVLLALLCLIIYLCYLLPRL